MYNVKTCDALWQYVKITISNIGFRWFSNMDLDAGVLKMWEAHVWKIVASRKSSTGFKTARVTSRKSHSFLSHCLKLL